MSSDLSKLSAFVTGRVIHQGTGEPVLGAVRITSPEGRVWSRVLDDGTFVVAADLEMLMPDLATQQYDINLVIRADSQQFRPGFIERTEPVSVPAGSDFDPDPPATPPDPLVSLGTIAFAADPINIRGRVIQAENPDQGIPGATVTILHSGAPIPAQNSVGAEGSYRFDDVVITGPSQIQCSAIGFRTVTRILLLDYTRFVNEENFRLPPS